MGKLIVQPRQDDPTSIVRAIAHLDSKLNTDATPTWAGGTISGDLSVGGTLDVTGGITLGSLTASRLTATNVNKELVSADLYAWMVGTTNQVTVTDDGDGTVTLSLPQDIHTGATPTFAGLTLTDDIDMGCNELKNFRVHVVADAAAMGALGCGQGQACFREDTDKFYGRLS